MIYYIRLRQIFTRVRYGYIENAGLIAAANASKPMLFAVCDPWN